MSIDREKAKRRRLDAIYTEVPAIECKGLCTHSCGVIVMTAVEGRRMGLKMYDAPPAGLECPMLRDARCTVHPVRPLICRLYGVAEGMPCPHGCKPARVLSDREAGELIIRTRAVGGEVVCTHQIGSLEAVVRQDHMARKAARKNA